MTIYSGFSHYKWPFSIAMLNYQRVISDLPYLHIHHILWSIYFGFAMAAFSAAMPKCACRGSSPESETSVGIWIRTWNLETSLRVSGVQFWWKLLELRLELATSWNHQSPGDWKAQTGKSVEWEFWGIDSFFDCPSLFSNLGCCSPGGELILNTKL